MRRCSVKCEVCIWQCAVCIWQCAVCSVKLLACSSHHVEVIDATWTQPGTSEVGTLGKELFLLFTRRAAFFLLSGPQSMRSSMTSLTNFDSANYHSSIHPSIQRSSADTCSCRLALKRSMNMGTGFLMHGMPPEPRFTLG